MIFCLFICEGMVPSELLVDQFSNVKDSISQITHRIECLSRESIDMLTLNMCLYLSNTAVATVDTAGMDLLIVKNPDLDFADEASDHSLMSEDGDDDDDDDDDDAMSVNSRSSTYSEGDIGGEIPEALNTNVSLIENRLDIAGIPMIASENYPANLPWKRKNKQPRIIQGQRLVEEISTGENVNFVPLENVLPNADSDDSVSGASKSVGDIIGNAFRQELESMNETTRSSQRNTRRSAVSFTNQASSNTSANKSVSCTTSNFTNIALDNNKVERQCNTTADLQPGDEHAIDLRPRKSQRLNPGEGDYMDLCDDSISLLQISEDMSALSESIDGYLESNRKKEMASAKVITSLAILSDDIKRRLQLHRGAKRTSGPVHPETRRASEQLRRKLSGSRYKKVLDFCPGFLSSGEALKSCSELRSLENIHFENIYNNNKLHNKYMSKLVTIKGHNKNDCRVKALNDVAVSFDETYISPRLENDYGRNHLYGLNTVMSLFQNLIYAMSENDEEKMRDATIAKMLSVFLATPITLGEIGMFQVANFALSSSNAMLLNSQDYEVDLALTAGGFTKFLVNHDSSTVNVKHSSKLCTHLNWVDSQDTLPTDRRKPVAYPHVIYGDAILVHNCRDPQHVSKGVGNNIGHSTKNGSKDLYILDSNTGELCNICWDQHFCDRYEEYQNKNKTLRYRELNNDIFNRMSTKSAMMKQLPIVKLFDVKIGNIFLQLLEDNANNYNEDEYCFLENGYRAFNSLSHHMRGFYRIMNGKLHEGHEYDLQGRVIRRRLTIHNFAEPMHFLRNVVRYFDEGLDRIEDQEYDKQTHYFSYQTHDAISVTCLAIASFVPYYFSIRHHEDIKLDLRAISSSDCMERHFMIGKHDADVYTARSAAYSEARCSRERLEKKACFFSNDCLIQKKPNRPFENSVKLIRGNINPEDNEEVEGYEDGVKWNFFNLKPAHKAHENLKRSSNAQSSNLSKVSKIYEIKYHCL